MSQMKAGERRFVPRRDMSGADLRSWRLQQNGEFKIRNTKEDGWSQAQAAEWYGVSRRQWGRWEKLPAGRLPLSLVKNLMRYGSSYHAIVDRMFDTPGHKVEEWGGVVPQIATPAKEG